MPGLTEASLQELALRYVGKYATTRAKLRSYLARKIRERGFEDQGEPDLEAIANRFAELGYVDDAAYALSKSRALSARGYGRRRLADNLRLAGITDEDSMEANEHATSEAARSALRFAQRRRLGPYATCAARPGERDKWITAMVRAGHGFALSRVIASLSPGESIAEDELDEIARIADA